MLTTFVKLGHIITTWVSHFCESENNLLKEIRALSALILKYFKV